MKQYIKADISDILDESYDVQFQTARDPNTAPRVLARLAAYRGSHYYDILAQLASNKNTPPDTLADIYNNCDSDGVRNRVLKNSNIPLSIIDDVFDKLNYSPEATKQYLMILMQVLIALASNPRVPAHYLQQLAKLDSPQINVYLAENPNTPKDVIEALYKLAERTRGTVLFVALASNPSIPDTLRKTIVNDLGLEVWFRFYINECDVTEVNLSQVNTIARSVLNNFGYLLDRVDTDYGVFDDTDNIDRIDIYTEWIPTEDEREQIIESLAKALHSSGHYSIYDMEYEDAYDAF